ncbi:MAG TPA: hypothetical protein VKS98_01730 [Chthoniobacterales bacterium]|nr:hypothetical protein [Chthoniobacterales bacterium]
MTDNITPPPAPAPAPATPVAVAPAKRYQGMAITSWILLIFTGLLAIVPLLGFASALMVWIVGPLVIIFAIVIMTRGGTGHGIILIILALLLFPWSFLAPAISTLLLGASVNAQEQAQEKQIINNLNKIDAAKTTWASDTGASAGTAVTMTELTKYLNGQEIKTIVGETYDPHPVGEAPAAKLPATKSLASHKGGEEITAASSAAPTSSTSPAASPSPSASADEEE